MIVAGIALLYLLTILNVGYYELFVFKGKKEPKYITGSYIELEMRRSKVFNQIGKK